MIVISLCFCVVVGCGCFVVVVLVVVGGVVCVVVLLFLPGKKEHLCVVVCVDGILEDAFSISPAC